MSDMYRELMQYTMTTALKYESIIDKNINELLSWFKRMGTLDISEWIQYFTMDASLVETPDPPNPPDPLTDCVDM